MKKYKRSIPMLPIKIMLYIFLGQVVLLAIACIICIDSTYTLAIGFFTMFIAFLLVFSVLTGLPQFSICEEVIRTYFGCILLRKIPYSKIHTIYISNAESGTAGALHWGKQPICKKRDGEKIQLPFVTLAKSELKTDRLHTGMSNHNITRLIEDDKLYDFLYDQEIFLVLVSHLEAEIYILEDVYLRYRKEFLEAIASDTACKFIIVKTTREEIVARNKRISQHMQ